MVDPMKSPTRFNRISLAMESINPNAASASLDGVDHRLGSCAMCSGLPLVDYDKLERSIH